nr:hypothetical protein [uncultured bacterium]
MQTVARLLTDSGHKVSGSDIKDFDASRDLKCLGMEIFIGHDKNRITKEIDEVIYSAAIPETNPELQMARKLGITIRRRLEPVGDLMKSKTGIAIAGTHGKTTTTTMTALILQAAGRDPLALIGAEVKDAHSNVMLGHGPFMVVEACEYSRSFLDLSPKIAVITNIEADHLDYYRDLDEIKDAFTDFLKLLPKDGIIIANGDDSNVREVVGRVNRSVVWAGLESGNDVRATDIEFREGRLYFSVNGTRLHLQVPGRHNVADAVLAWAVAQSVGIDDQTIKHVLQDGFRGVQRRFEILGTTSGVTFVDDYAHHPTEITAMLEGAREYFGKRRLWVVFHPHQFSRTRILLNDFARSFRNADTVLVAPIYAVRDSDADKKSIDSEQLVEAINQVSGNAKYLGNFSAIEDFLIRELKPGDVLLTLGAGEANLFGRELLDKLRQQSQAVL